MSSQQSVTVPVAGASLNGDLIVPADAGGVVLFAHGSGSSRHSPRNRFVARALGERGFGTLLIDLLTPAEEWVDGQTAQLRFDIDLLADRLSLIVDWLRATSDTATLPIGLLGASPVGVAA